MSNNFLNNQKIEGLEIPRASFEEIKWEVQFSSTNLIHVAEWTREEIERITRYESNVLDYIPETQELKRYFSTLMYLRVKVVRKEQLPQGIKASYIRRLFIPARFATILAMVGEVLYPDVSLRILPKYQAEIVNGKEDIMTMDELQEVSIKLERFFGDGFCGVLGMSMDRYGDPHYMNKIAMVDGKILDCIKSMTKDNPLYGFMAWLTNAELLDVAYQEARYLLRVNYSAPGIYDMMARSIWNKVKPEDTMAGKNTETPSADGLKTVFEDTDNN